MGLAASASAIQGEAATDNPSIAAAAPSAPAQPSVAGTLVAQSDPLEFQERRCERLLALAKENPRLEIERAEAPKFETVFVKGQFTVPENRVTGEGRQIKIGFAVLPARAEHPAADPIFILHGGPGAPATAHFRRQLNGWLRESRDVVLIDQRGTGSSNKLQVELAGSDDNLQGYFESYFQVERFQAALPRLQAMADLTQYTTANAVDDFDEIRAALGYQTINLRGGSYGSRSALIFMRRHPTSIRTASLQGIAPIAFRNPLPHARGAQEVLDLVFDEIHNNPLYAEAFPDLEAKFLQTLERLSQNPATVTVTHPTTGKDSEIVLNRDAFAEAVRMQLYTMPNNRKLPLKLMQAFDGNYRPLAEASLSNHRSMQGLLAWGMLMCVTGSEDIPWIDPDEIEAACQETFLGTTRVRQQMAVAAIWPSGRIPASAAEAVQADVPVLLFSGTHDPTTTPYWGAEAASHLPNSLHVVVPGGHGVFGPEVLALDRAFLESASVKGLDLRAIGKLKLPPLELR
jgi:pimeloyl-ACP methyl ester carboxylesterase